MKKSFFTLWIDFFTNLSSRKIDLPNMQILVLVVNCQMIDETLFKSFSIVKYMLKRITETGLKSQQTFA